MRKCHAELVGVYVSAVDRNFAPARNFLCLQEIGGYAWHKVADLPATRDEGNQTFLSEDGVKHKFFMVRPDFEALRLHA